MRTFDLSPLFRNTVGFDRFDRLIDGALNNTNEGPSFPAYDIVKFGEDNYRVTLAVAGYGESDIEITQEGRVLTITGKAGGEESENQPADPASWHRPARLHPPFPSGRHGQGDRRRTGEWPAERRSGQRDPRGREAPDNRDQRRSEGPVASRIV